MHSQRHGGWQRSERSAAAGYVVIIILALFGGRGEMQSCDFAYPPEPRGMPTVLVMAHSVGCGCGGKKGSWRKLQGSVIN